MTDPDGRERPEAWFVPPTAPSFTSLPYATSVRHQPLEWATTLPGVRFGAYRRLSYAENIFLR